MARLIYSMLMSADGYVEDEHGDFGWGAPNDEELHSWINELGSSFGTYLYGRRMYETMVYWETAHTLPDQPPFVLDYWCSSEPEVGRRARLPQRRRHPAVHRPELNAHLSWTTSAPRNHLKVGAGNFRCSARLADRVVAMPETDAVALLRGAPYFPVAGIVDIGRHYTEVLGFTCEYSAGNPPEFAVYSRSGCPIMLRRVADASLIRPNESQGGTWDVFFWVDDVERLHAELVRKGADVVYDPIVQPYGMKEFAVRDPAGYVLGFGQEWTQ